MQKELKSFLKFNNYIIDKIEFTYNCKCEDKEEFSLDFNINVDYQVNESNMIVILDLEVFKDAEKNNYPFNLKLRTVAFFEMNVENENINQYKANAVAILFPYVRSLVTTLTANSNVAPLILPAINVNKLIKENSVQEYTQE